MKTLLLILALIALPAVAQEAADPIDAAGLPTDEANRPVLYFGMKTCKAEVIWVLLYSGRFILFDDDHHPADVAAFWKALKGLPNDMHMEACTSA